MQAYMYSVFVSIALVFFVSHITINLNLLLTILLWSNYNKGMIAFITFVKSCTSPHHHGKIT